MVMSLVFRRWGSRIPRLSGGAGLLASPTVSSRIDPVLGEILETRAAGSSASPPMPSLLYEGRLAMVREGPAVAAELLHELLHVPIPEVHGGTTACRGGHCRHRALASFFQRSLPWHRRFGRVMGSLIPSVTEYRALPRPVAEMGHRSSGPSSQSALAVGADQHFTSPCLR
jgi:hypothetical protein